MNHVDVIKCLEVDKNLKGEKIQIFVFVVFNIYALHSSIIQFNFSEIVEFTVSIKFTFN